MSRRHISDTSVLKEMILSDTNSRRDLGKKLGVSKAAMTQSVNRLIEADLVEEGASFNELRRGRKTISLKVKPDIVYFLGTDIEGLSIHACLLDCDKRVISSAKHTISPSWSINKILNQWAEVVEEVIESAQVDIQKIVCVGIGLPGKVAQNGGLRSRAILPPGRWTNLDANIILRKYNLNAKAAHSVFCVAEYERRIGRAQHSNNFVTIVLRYGSGAAIFANGAYITGEEYLTGELGHMRVDINGPKCFCGQRGCLDTLISGRTWIEKNITSDALLRKELLKRAKYLAIGLGNFFKIIHMPLAIIDGIYNEYKYYFKPYFLDALNLELKELDISPPEIVFGDTVEFKASIGAAILAADVFLQDYLDGMLHK